MLKTIYKATGLAAASALALSGVAYAGDETTPPSDTPSAVITPKTKPRLTCKGVRTFIGWEHRNDNGHGTPSEWAELSFLRKVIVKATGYAEDHKGCTYVITVRDAGSLSTIKGAGYPNGSDGHIKCAVLGHFSGWYVLKATGYLKQYGHLNTTLASTAQVQALFHGTVSGGAYAWDYVASGQHWKDASWNGDGTAPSAGNITGGECETPTPTPTPVDSSPEVTPIPTPTTPTTEPAPATPVDGQPNFTG